MPPLTVTIDGRRYIVAWPDEARPDLTELFGAGSALPSRLRLVNGADLVVNWPNVATLEVAPAEPVEFVRTAVGLGMATGDTASEGG
ncbi:MAG TPA: hypothetical protein VMU51_38080 [Mycobacteriales bacterium]|nr:hypothetical protein [Mycobacteriales bacterium]